jgi:hypothetical protein
MKKMKPVQTIRMGADTQRLYRFDNGYGASLVRHPHSIGYDRGLYEVAVIRWVEPDAWSLCFTSPITDDVLGGLDEDEVMAVLEQIEGLPVGSNKFGGHDEEF